MDPTTALILALGNLALNVIQQLTDLQQKQANGTPLTEADLATERQKTQDLLAQSDALRATPRQP